MQPGPGSSAAGVWGEACAKGQKQEERRCSWGSRGAGPPALASGVGLKRREPWGRGQPGLGRVLGPGDQGRDGVGRDAPPFWDSRYHGHQPGSFPSSSLPRSSWTCGREGSPGVGLQPPGENGEDPPSDVHQTCQPRGDALSLGSGFLGSNKERFVSD